MGNGLESRKSSTLLNILWKLERKYWQLQTRYGTSNPFLSLISFLWRESWSLGCQVITGAVSRLPYRRIVDISSAQLLPYIAHFFPVLSKINFLRIKIKGMVFFNLRCPPVFSFVKKNILTRIYIEWEYRFIRHCLLYTVETVNNFFFSQMKEYESFINLLASLILLTTNRNM